MEHGASHTSFITRTLEKPAIQDEAQALFEEARRRTRRRRRRTALVIAILLAIPAAAGVLVATGSDEEPSDRGSTPQASVRTTTRLYVQLLRKKEPVGVVNPQTGALRLADLPTVPGDPPDRLHWTGGKLVFFGTRGISAVDRDLKGPPQKLGEGSYFLPSATRGRVWLISSSWRDRKAEVVEVTVHGRVVSRSTLRIPCRGSIVAAASGALLCQRTSGLTAFDPATGRAMMQITGPFPLATAGPLVTSCGRRCAELHLTNVRTGRKRVIRPGRSFRFVESYDGAFSPDRSLLAVPVDQYSRVALIDVRRGTARVVPASRLDAQYGKLTWSSSGELFFAAGRGRIMRYQPGAPRAKLLSVRLHAPLLGLAAD